MSEQLKAIVLAAGKGTRLRTEGIDLPKVLREAAAVSYTHLTLPTTPYV